MLNIEIYAASHSGQVRRNNEDNFLLLNISNSEMLVSSQNVGDLFIESREFEINENGVVLAVSDGVGGALGGEVASQIAMATVSRRLLHRTVEQQSSTSDSKLSLGDELYGAVVCANDSIYRQGHSNLQLRGMGATFTGAGITPGRIDFIQVGDSRGYLIRNTQIYQLTKDQSLVQELVDLQQISLEEAETHKLKNIILQALGAKSAIRPIFTRLLPRENDILLICSDGLSDKLLAGDLLQIVIENQNNLRTACDFLIKKANERGGEDNITVILARISGLRPQQLSKEEVDLETLDKTDFYISAN